MALVNVLNLKPGGLGNIGADQLAWLKEDLQGKSASTPIVVLAHMPLWTVSAEWGWGTDDGAEAISYLKPFGSVTVLNGHIHQVDPEDRGQRHLPDGDVHGLPASGAGYARRPSGAHEGSGRAAQIVARRARGRAVRGQARRRDHRHPAPVDRQRSPGE